MRGNISPFMTKTSRKSIMIRSRLKTSFNKTRSDVKSIRFKKTRSDALGTLQNTKALSCKIVKKD